MSLRGKARRSSLAPILFVAPAVLLLTAFWLAPILASTYIAFTNWSGLGKPIFTGLENFRDLLQDPAFLSGAANTLWYAIACLVILIPLGLGIALLMNSRRVRGRAAFRTIIFLPTITSTVAIAIAFLLLLDTQFGLVNHVLAIFHLGPVPWLTSSAWSKPSVLLFVAWGSVGFIMVYFVAGLQAIPPEVIEAASIDGASRWQILRRLTIPLLRPTMTFVIVIVTINSLQILAEPYILTAGGPSNSSVSLGLALYQDGIMSGRLGYASAIGLVIFVVTICVSLVQLRILGVFRAD